MDKRPYRQGDVLVKHTNMMGISEVLSDSEKEFDFNAEHRVVLAYGEVTGHAHAIYDQNARLFKKKDCPHLYLVVDNSTLKLKHEEHDEIELQPNIYLVKRQRQFTRGKIVPVYD